MKFQFFVRRSMPLPWFFDELQSFTFHRNIHILKGVINTVMCFAKISQLTKTPLLVIL